MEPLEGAALRWALAGVAALAPAVAYGLRARTLARRGRPVAPARFVPFCTGLAVIFAALVLPLEDSFSAHMGQHLLLGDLGAILVVLGLDGPLLRPLLSVPGLRRLRGLGYPLVAFPLWTANLVVWHLPPPYDAALASPTLHALQHGLFLGAGLLLWAALLEPLPGPEWFGPGWKAAFVVAMGTVAAALANVFLWSGAVVYDRYQSLADQRLGGALMLGEGTALTLTLLALFFLRWMRESELRQRLVERGGDPAAVARAVRYGRAALK
jgi:putative membrane protein